MNNPLIGYATGIIFGIFTGYRFNDGLILAITAPVIILSIYRLIDSHKHLLLATLIAFVIGHVSALSDMHHREDEIEKLTSCSPAPIIITATISPEINMIKRKGNGAIYEIPLHDISIPSQNIRISRIPVKLRWYGAKPGTSPIEAPKPGERWKIKGGIRRSSYASIFPVAIITSSCDISEKLPAPAITPWRQKCEIARQKAITIIERGAGDWENATELLKAFLLGCRSDIPPAIRNDFAASGTIHIFAISGLHIMLIAGIFTAIFSIFGIPKPTWILPSAPLLIFYTIATGARPSAIRACAMALIYIAAPAFGKKPNILAALALTASTTFSIAPSLVYDIGCQLSFAAMIGIIAFFKPVNTLLLDFSKTQRLLNMRNELAASGRNFSADIFHSAYKAAKFIIATFSVSLAAWMASIPLTAIYFDRFTPAGLIANIFISPCTLLVAVSGIAGLFFGLFSDFAGSCFINSACLFTSLMTFVSRLTASIPGGNIDISNHRILLLTAWLSAAAILWFLLRKSKVGHLNS